MTELGKSAEKTEGLYSRDLSEIIVTKARGMCFGYRVYLYFHCIQ